MPAPPSTGKVGLRGPRRDHGCSRAEIPLPSALRRLSPFAMTITELLQREAAPQLKATLIAATLAGISNALILGLASYATDHHDDVSFRVLALYVLAVALYVLTARKTHHVATGVIEDALQRIKQRIAHKVERAEAAGIERVGMSEVYDRITENTATISDSAGPVANLMMSLCVLAAAAIYVMWLSPEGFVFVAMMIGVGMALFWNQRQIILDRLQQTSAQRVVFFDSLTDLLRGFKETKFSRKRSEEVLTEVLANTKVLRDLSAETHILFDDLYIFTNVVLFALLCVLTMILPQYIAFDAITIGALTAAVLFAWNPIAGIAGGVPAYLRTNVALEQIATLEAKLDEIASDARIPPADEPSPWAGGFTKLELRGFEFQYEDGVDAGFRVGPVDLEVAAGEILFIVGGNGSGKTTLFKALTGMYRPSAGSILVDGQTIGADNIVAYRELISAIFSDFHLFTKLYGLLDVEQAEADKMLELMGLRDKTKFAEHRFTNRELSTGQRKRLAMIVALLEDRPLCCFDEWAADQDPEFRKFFYEELLPMLISQGKTVIAISHDDRYFDCADRILTLDYGKVRSFERVAPSPSPAPAPAPTPEPPAP